MRTITAIERTTKLNKPNSDAANDPCELFANDHTSPPDKSILLMLQTIPANDMRTIALLFQISLSY
jgi:hypothetical protein